MRSLRSSAPPRPRLAGVATGTQVRLALNRRRGEFVPCRLALNRRRGDGDESRLAAFAGYQVGSALLDLAGPRAVAKHCLPAYRGQEITGGILDGPRSFAIEQTENRLHVQKAFLVETLARD